MSHYLTVALPCVIVSEEADMLCKRTYKNQITIPKKVMEKFNGVEYFEARIHDGAIVLEPVVITPLRRDHLEAARRKFASLGLSERDIQEAVIWARARKEKAAASNARKK